MKKVSSIVECSCDICGKKCDPVKKLEIPFSHFMDLTISIRLYVSAYVPYGCDNGDVCEDCLKKSLVKWLNN